MKKIAVATATRAEYGILTPLLRRIDEDKDLDLQLIVTGTHLSKAFGYTKQHILADGFWISYEVKVSDGGGSSEEISGIVAETINGFASVFANDRPDMLVILGDRTEMLGVAVTAMNERIPIAHIHGGEITAGAVDDCIRHALTKMSYLHFASAEAYRQRIIQLGEHPDRVFNVGSLGTENILNAKLLDEKTLRIEAGIPEGKEFAVVTFHPATLEEGEVSRQVDALCDAMLQMPDVFFLITMANADHGGLEVNRLLTAFAERHSAHARLVSSLGMQKYLSAVKYASFVLGNSSSGIIEAPVIGTPTVNIGDRQKGRLMVDSIIASDTEAVNILAAMKRAKKMPHIPTRIYGDGTTSYLIVQEIKSALFKKRIDLKKGFFDMGGNV